MRDWLNEYFGFTKREYNGLLVLMGMLLIISILPSIYSRYFTNEEIVTPEDRGAIDRLSFIRRQHVYAVNGPQNEIEQKEGQPNVTLFKFDPNQITRQQWQQLGLSAKQAQSILNYKAKGGKFYRPSDLKKMYAVSPEKFAQLEPYIHIDSSATGHRFNDRRQYKSLDKVPRAVIEMNGADTLELDRINGIGPAFARRIVKYRERLGGFHKKEQLMEVFGLDTIKYLEISEQIEVNPRLVKKINLNTADFETLKNHPYLKYKQINAIIQYRKQHGNYNSIDDLKKVLILTPQNIQSLAPYLSFDD